MHALEKALDLAFKELARTDRKAPGNVALGDHLNRLYAIRDEIQLLDQVDQFPLAGILRTGGKIAFAHLGVVLSGDPDVIERHPSAILRVDVTDLDGCPFFVRSTAPCQYILRENPMLNCVANIKSEVFARGVLALPVSLQVA